MSGTLINVTNITINVLNDWPLQIDDIYSRGKVPVVVGGTSYYIESIVYNNLVRRPDGGEEAEDEEETSDHDNSDGAEHLTLAAFREYAPFRNGNDRPTVDTADAAGRLYADALAEAVRFARTMPAVGRLSRKRYRNTFVPAATADDHRSRWPRTVAECETAALCAHGVRVLDAVTAAGASADVRYEVSAADVAVGHRERYALADVRSRLDALLRRTGAGRGTADEQPAVREALCRTHAELEKRTQRLALALLADREQTAVSLLTPVALKTHAAYFDPVAAHELHPHNTRKVFRYVLCIQWSAFI